MRLKYGHKRMEANSGAEEYRGNHERSRFERLFLTKDYWDRLNNGATNDATKEDWNIEEINEQEDVEEDDEVNGPDNEYSD
jgi:hypothetical protein